MAMTTTSSRYSAAGTGAGSVSMSLSPSSRGPDTSQRMRRRMSSVLIYRSPMRAPAVQPTPTIFVPPTVESDDSN
jgi:hypothetical protein